MAWNITQDPVYTAAIEAEWLKRTANLRIRSAELDDLLRGSEATAISKFSKSAGIWAQQRKSIDRVEAFLFNLHKAGKGQAHYECMKAWAEAIHQKPSSFHDYLQIANLPKRGFSEPATNNYFSPTDSFEALNGYLAIDPMGCLQQPDLLSKNWVDGLGHEQKSDAAVIAILSAFYRYGDQMDRVASQTPGNYGKGRVAHVNSLLGKIADSAGLSFLEILEKLPETKKATPVVNKYFSTLVTYRHGTSGVDVTYAISKLYNVMVSSGLFELAMKARLFSTNAYEKALGRRDVKSEDEMYINWVIDSKFLAISELKAAVIPLALSAEHISDLHKRDLAIPYIKSLDQDTRYEMIEKRVIPPNLLTRAKDRGRMLEADLGL